MNRIGLLGCGTVGSGVKELIEKNSDKYSLIKVFDMPSKKEMLGKLYASSYENVCTSPYIDTVIECLGGDEIAYPAIKMALENSKNVITSNKETVSLHLQEYLSLAKKNYVSFRFEAAVGGGIPLLDTVLKISDFDELVGFEGILNGTTNYIITKMFDEDMDFEEALSLAQSKGFAEKDPTADLLGLDMVRKGKILSELGYHIKVDQSQIPNRGIASLNKNIVREIKKMGKYLKFVVKSSYDSALHLEITPILIDLSSPLVAVKNEFNAVYLHYKNNDDIVLSGKGAGKIPTAGAIMQDLTLISQDKGFINLSFKEVNNVITQNKKYFVVDNDNYEVVDKLDNKEYLFIAEII
jgi:homoserine dehydrogenase